MKLYVIISGMKIQKTDNVSPFKAKISISTDEMENFMRYLHNNVNAPEGWYNSSQDLSLINKIMRAFNNHPSDEIITPDVLYIKGALYNARGTLQSSRAKLTDTEPARSDSIAPLLNIFRRILDPENKASLIKLTGEEHAYAYDNWWKENIAPIWNDIKTNFREATFFRENYDKEFNEDFNRQSGNFWIKIWKKMYR